MHTIIMADGVSKDSHHATIGGVNRHFLPTEKGVPLLERTVSQFAPYGPVTVVAPQTDPYTGLVGAEIWTPVRTPELKDLDMVYKTIPLWNDSGLTCLVYGDVWFTDSAVVRICNEPFIRAAQDGSTWLFHGRYGASSWGLAQWGEQFAITFWESAHDLFKEAIRDVGLAHYSREVRKLTVWEWYYKLDGLPLRIHGDPGPHWHEIDDATDDIDFIADYEAHKGLRRME